MLIIVIIFANILVYWYSGLNITNISLYHLLQHLPTENSGMLL